MIKLKLVNGTSCHQQSIEVERTSFSAGTISSHLSKHMQCIHIALHLIYGIYIISYIYIYITMLNILQASYHLIRIRWTNHLDLESQNSESLLGTSCRLEGDPGRVCGVGSHEVTPKSSKFRLFEY